MKQAAIILLFAGTAVFTVILGYYGAGEIASALVGAGAGLVLVTASHFLPLWLDSVVWRPLLFINVISENRCASQDAGKM